MPPDAVTVAEPVEFPKHNTLVTVVEVASAEAGWEIVTAFVVVHPEASVTVTVLTPEVCPVITDVVAPVDQA